jgi:hypothetical protein
VTPLSLQAIAGPAEGRMFEVPPAGLVLGRTVNGDGRLTGDETLSGTHARLAWTTDGSLVVEDLGSTNGTYVNGDRIGGPWSVSFGDVIAVGRNRLEVVGHARETTEAYGAGSSSSAMTGGQRAERGGVIVGGSVQGGIRTSVDVDASGLTAWSKIRGPARALIGLGMALALAGFVSFGYPIISAISSGANADPGSSPDFEAKPWIPLGGVLFVLGAFFVLAGQLIVRQSDDS